MVGLCPAWWGMFSRGNAGTVWTGYARCGMERQCLAGEARFVPFRYVRERMGSVRQAIKGGIIIYGLQMERCGTVENRCPNSR